MLLPGNVRQVCTHTKAAMLPAGGRDTYWYLISSGKVTNRDPNFDRKDFPGEGHLNQDLKDKEALTRHLGVGDS